MRFCGNFWYLSTLEEVVLWLDEAGCSLHLQLVVNVALCIAVRHYYSDCSEDREIIAPSAGSSIFASITATHDAQCPSGIACPQT